MIAWVAVWDGDPDLHGRAEEALRSMTDVQPGLAGAGLERFDEAGRAWAAALVPTAGGPAAGRRPDAVAAAPGSFAVADGFAVRAGRVLGAADVAAAFPDPASLDGQYAVLRCTPRSMELTNDALGIRHVYHARAGRAHLVANSVEVLARAVGGSIDHHALALYLAFGWPLGDRTLWDGVGQLGGGRAWRWDEGGFHDGSWYSIADLALPHRRVDPGPMAEALQSMLAAVAEGGGLYVPLSGGLDSRLIAALVDHAGIPARYYTVGSPESADALLAPVLAKLIGAGHDHLTQVTADVVDDWDRIAPSYVRRTDGLASVWLIGDTVNTAAVGANGGVVVHGVGGEMARRHWMPPTQHLWPSTARLIAYFLRRIDKVGLVGAAATAEATDYATVFVDRVGDLGFAPRDVPMTWYAFERARRWGGANNRKIADQAPVFTPFCTRPFMEAAFSLRAPVAFTQPFHRQLIARLSPPLRSVPPDTGRWPSAVPFLDLLTQRVRGLTRRSSPPARPGIHDQVAWIEALRHDFVERHADDAGAAVWDLVDRDRFREVLLEDDPTRRRRAASTILTIVTASLYEQARRAEVLPRAS